VLREPWRDVWERTSLWGSLSNFLELILPHKGIFMSIYCHFFPSLKYHITSHRVYHML
jgi:hypothetical protein